MVDVFKEDPLVEAAPFVPLSGRFRHDILPACREQQPKPAGLPARPPTPTATACRTPPALPSLASTPAAEHHLKATLTISPGPLRLTATGSQLKVVDATDSGRCWHLALGGDVRVNSFQCAPHSTCILPMPGVVGDVVTADPGTGMGSVIFNTKVSGRITANLLTGP